MESPYYYLELLGIKDKGTNLNRLPVRSILWTSFIQESRMRSQPSPVNFRIITLDQRDLFGGLSAQIVPPQLPRSIIPHPVDPARALRVDEVDGDEVHRVERAPVGDRERLVRDWVADGPPDVDDADTALEEPLGVVSEMTIDALHTGVERLVYVNAFLLKSSITSISQLFSGIDLQLVLGYHACLAAKHHRNCA